MEIIKKEIEIWVGAAVSSQTAKVTAIKIYIVKIENSIKFIGTINGQKVFQLMVTCCIRELEFIWTF